jgi:hypothetical protein
MTPKQKSALVAIVFFLLMVLPITVVLLKEKLFTPKQIQVIAPDTTKVKK